MRLDHLPPAPALRPFVERYWRCTAGPGALPAVLPGTGAELWIHRTGRVDLSVVNGQGTRALPSAHLVCLRRQTWRLSAPGAVDFVAIRFRAGALGRFVAPAVDQLADTVVDIEELWGTAGRRLAERVGLAATPDALRQVLDDRLTALVPAARAPAPHVQEAVRQLYRRPAGARMDHLARHAGMSLRQLQRTFPPLVGVGPKEFQRLARFQRLTRSLLRTGRSDYLPAALSAGYYDQNHFIREFRRFTGRRPTDLLTSTTSHFYYAPLTPLDEAPR